MIFCDRYGPTLPDDDAGRGDLRLMADHLLQSGRMCLARGRIGGHAALGMVARGELTGVSCGYRVTEWQVTDDEDGRIVNQANTYWEADDNFTYLAHRWEFILVALPAPARAAVMPAMNTKSREVIWGG